VRKSGEIPSEVRGKVQDPKIQSSLPLEVKAWVRPLSPSECPASADPYDVQPRERELGGRG